MRGNLINPAFFIKTKANRYDFFFLLIFSSTGGKNII
jgi:hypothetical protein